MLSRRAIQFLRGKVNRALMRLFLTRPCTPIFTPPLVSAHSSQPRTASNLSSRQDSSEREQFLPTPVLLQAVRIMAYSFPLVETQWTWLWASTQQLSSRNKMSISFGAFGSWSDSHCEYSIPAR